MTHTPGEERTFRVEHLNPDGSVKKTQYAHTERTLGVVERDHPGARVTEIDPVECGCTRHMHYTGRNSRHYTGELFLI